MKVLIVKPDFTDMSSKTASDWLLRRNNSPSERWFCSFTNKFLQVDKKYPWNLRVGPKSQLWFSFCHISLNKYLFAKHPECDELFEFTETSSNHHYNSKDGFLKGLAYSLCGNEVHCYINEEKGERLLCLRALSAPCRGQQDYLLYHGEHNTNSKRFYALYLFSTEVLRPELCKKQDISPNGPEVC